MSVDRPALTGPWQPTLPALLMEQRLPASLRSTYREYFGHAAVANLGEWRTGTAIFLLIRSN
jgi:hypothetical protein